MDDISDEFLKNAKTIDGEQEEPLLLCLKCNKCIPSVIIIRNEEDAYIEMTCQGCKSKLIMRLEEYLSSVNQKTIHLHYCMKDGHSNYKASKYCMECKKWVCQSCILDHQYYAKDHQFFSREIILDSQCNEHSKVKLSYCNTCLNTICKKCKEKTHKDHSITEFEALKNDIEKITDKQIIDEMKSIRTKIEKDKNALVNKINEKINKWNKKKNEVILAYEINKRINKQMEKLVIHLLGNFEVLRNLPSYEMLANVTKNVDVKHNNIELNSKKCSENIKSFFSLTNEQFYIKFQTQYTPTLNEKYKCVQSITTDSEINTIICLKDNRIAIGCSDNLIRISDIAQKKFDIVLKEHTKPIVSLLQLKDGRLVSCSTDLNLLFWDIQKQTCTKKLQEDVSCMYQLKNGSLATGLRNNKIKIWNLSKFKCINIFNYHYDVISSVIELKDNRLASASWDKSIKLWNSLEVKSAPVGNLLGHDKPVTSILQLKDERLISSSLDKTILLWDIRELVMIRKIGQDISSITPLYQLNDNCVIAGNGDCIILLSSFSNRIITQVIGHSRSVTGVVSCLNGPLISSSLDKTIKFWSK